MATTAFCSSAKVELMQAGHCFNALLVTTADTHSSTLVDNIGLSTAPLSVGMSLAASGVPAGAIVSRILTATSVQLDVAATTSVPGNSVTFSSDVFEILLIKDSPAQTYGANQTNVGTPGSGTPSTSNVGTDETSGSGYTSGGQTLTNVSTPRLSSSIAITTWGTNPSWTGASFSTTAAIIYNNSTRQGAAAAPLNGRTIGVVDLGGTQTVAGGTFTLLMPPNFGASAIIRIA